MRDDGRSINISFVASFVLVTLAIHPAQRTSERSSGIRSDYLILPQCSDALLEPQNLKLLIIRRVYEFQFRP